MRLMKAGNGTYRGLDIKALTPDMHTLSRVRKVQCKDCRRDEVRESFQEGYGQTPDVLQSKNNYCCKLSVHFTLYRTSGPKICGKAIEQESMTDRPENERFASKGEEIRMQDTEPSEPDDGINVSIAVEVAWCDECESQVEMGDESCPGCGAVVDVDWEEKAHLYNARKEVFGALAKALEDPPGSVAAVPITERQYLRFINGSHVLSAEPSERMTKTINSLDLSEPSTIRGSETRKAAEVLYQEALKFRRLIAELKSLRPYGVFAEPHGHLISAFEAYREHFRELAQALLARAQ